MTTNLLTSASSTRHHHTAARFGDSDTQEIQERAATALVTKGMALAKLGDYAAAIAAFDEVIARFGGGNVPEMLEWVVSWAWGANLGRSARRAWRSCTPAFGRFTKRLLDDIIASLPDAAVADKRMLAVPLNELWMR